MSEFRPIPNPFIVGNPIKSRDMFFGRQDDFEYIKRKLLSGVKSYIIVFCGERRSGKTSILFQVLNGELGEDFLPIMIDMQTMAGLQSENEFFEKIAKEAFKALDKNIININDYDFFQEDTSPYKVFAKLLDDVHAQYPNKNILFLIDEYELLESKIAEGSLNKNFVPFLAGVLESDRKISFLFTGSKKLDDRKSPYWNILFAKSLYRNVSFLSKNDTIRLMTEPVKEHLKYDSEVIDRIYRLTAGQPFYTQVVCQNIVDHLNENQKNMVEPGDLDEIVAEILENPLPQMIYFWNSLSNEKKLILSFLAEILEDSDTYVQAQDMHKFSRKREFGINLTLKTISTTLETLYHQQLLNKTENGYSFYMDLFRGWIKQDHSFWQVMKEISTDISGINVEESVSMAGTGYQEEPSFFEKGKKSRSRIMIPILASALLIVALGSYWLISRSSSGSQEPANQGANQPISENIAENDKPSAKGNESAPSNLASTDNDKQNEPPKTPAPTTTSKTTTRTEAANARSSMLRAKSGAQKAGAENTNAYQQGLSRETQAEESLKNGNYESASRLFARAASSFSEAKTGLNENLRNEANALLQDVIAARQKAQTDNAPQLASGTFSKAQSKENQGRALFDQGRYDESKTELMDAKRFYADAASEANRSSTRLAGEIRSIRNSIQQFKSQSTSDFQYMQEYQRAVEAESNGSRYLANGNNAQALEDFKSAEELYKKARTIHNERANQISQIIKKYETALESKNIQQLKSLYHNFSSEAQQRWSKLFDAVDKVEAEMVVQSTDFQQDRVLAMVNTHLKYSGFVNSDTRIKWEMEFTPVNDKLLINNINESR